MQAFNEKLQWVSRGIYKVFYVFATFTFAVLLAILLINVFSRNLLDWRMKKAMKAKAGL